LQLYARHCFVPAVQAVEALQEEQQQQSQADKADSTDVGVTSGTVTPANESSGGDSKTAEDTATTVAASSKKKSKVLEGLEDKLRELDVALGQCRRTTLGQIPHVLLHTHPILTQASSYIPSSGKIDFEALGLSSKLSDDDFLNEVQTGVTTWITQIRKVTILPATTTFPTITVADGTADDMNADLEEVSFWTNLDMALKHIQTELTKPSVLLTLSILKAAKRFVATIALQNNTGLEQAIHHTTDVTNYLRPYPIQTLVAARDWPKISTCMEDVFTHLPKVRQSRYYELERCVRLLEATTLTLRQRMSIALKEKYKRSNGILLMPYDEYEKSVHGPTQDIFISFEDQYNQFTEFIMEQARKRGYGRGALAEKTPGQIVENIILYHDSLRERLDAIHHFRTQHEKLRAVVTEVLAGSGDKLGSSGGSTSGKSTTTSEKEGEKDATTDADIFSARTAIREVNEAPIALFAAIDVLDLSPRGNLAFANALDGYDRKIDAIEERLAKLLREKLTACEDAEDMFGVFARFNPLLTRTRVRSAVKEFQVQLIATVGQAIQQLQSKFTQKFETSSASQISKIRGIPPVSGKILWAKQIERQVHALMRRMGDVLGPNWGQHLEGRQLRRSGDELLSKLDAKAFFRGWVSDWERQMSLEATTSSARLNTYPIKIARQGSSSTLVAQVNFDEKYELLFREIRHLKWLGFERDIPRTLATAADENLARYPYAMALKSALRSYQVTRELVSSDLEPLVFPQLKAIRDCVAEAFGISLDSDGKSTSRRVRWETKEMTDWVCGLSELVSRFEERVETLLVACDKVEDKLIELMQVEYKHDVLLAVVDNIQKTVDELSLAGYTELKSWVTTVDDRMKVILMKRLEDALVSWHNTFCPPDKTKEEKDIETSGDEKREDAPQTMKMDSIPTIPIEIILRNQEITCSPSILSVRTIFLKKLHDFIGIVCCLPRPTSGRFEVFDDVSSEPSSKAFDDLVHETDPEILKNAYSSIESHMLDLSNFVSEWLAYQTLWDTRASDVANAVGDKMVMWNSLLNEASELRNSLDAPAIVAEFGPVKVKYDKVQSQINLKYDSWQRELQSFFADMLGQKISEMHGRVSDSKNTLENITLDSSTPTQDIVLGVTFIQEGKENLEVWNSEVNTLIDAERLLKRQRHVFRSDWMECSRLTGQFHNMEQILAKRSSSMEEQMPILQSRVIAEGKSADERSKDLLVNWEQEKPLSGNMVPNTAKNILTKFEMSVNKAKTDSENIIKAKDALKLEASGSNNAIFDCIDEITDLKEVWNAVTEPYEKLGELKNTLWVSTSPRKIRKQLDDITLELRALPNKIRQYDAYIHLNDLIKSYISGYSILSDLKTEALKDRHWKKILEELGIRCNLSDLNLGKLWDNGVLDSKKEIMEILTIAQGEMALEVFLTQVRDRWTKQELDLVLYQNRVRLIRGWDNLFTVLDDHLGGLVLMKSSPYYRAVNEFQEEGKLWEDRLTRLRAAFDSWVDVQRRWIYLEGIFFGSSDIKAQLPTEWSRFKNVDGEFVSLMRRVSSRPYAIETLNIENLQRTLERLESLMIIIQRALGDYLAKQRSDFARFYFLGDDDLLEIIGNSDEPGKVLAHVGKMFAGMASARFDTKAQLTDGTVASFDAMVSKDGEVVKMNNSIEVSKNTTAKVWLKKLEDEMHNTLATLLLEAVNEDASTSSNNSGDKFVEWGKKYPAQVMILATLINWSMGVDKALSNAGAAKGALQKVFSDLEQKLEVMAETVLHDLRSDDRKKFEQLITELVHQRDVTGSLSSSEVTDPNDFRWLYHLRFKYSPEAENLTEKLRISLSNAHFFYGFEYLGIGERLVQTPLTDRCYLTLTQALRFRMGGNPFGPAGTGKTESVKALGSQLGRFVVVMNCDEAFDFGAMGRIFCGLCQVGAWGCFDEFNRLEERILSAVSQQILTIQRGLIERQNSIELLGRPIRLHENVGIFVTMNPGYAGRSNLPDNLKSLFRSVAMVVPDRKLIAQVMLYSQGIVSATELSGKVVSLFELCELRMSSQSHYDFSLRALKTLLISMGSLKRKSLEGSAHLDVNTIEKNVLIQGACNNVLPKLVAEDLQIFAETLNEVFPGSELQKMEDDKLREELVSLCEKMNYTPGENWMQKNLQLRQVLDMRHGVMLVGSTGSGKSSALKILLAGLEKIDGTKGEMYVIDPKAMDKEGLYGVLDGTTMEWTDGVFTSILRKIIANQKGEADRRHWVIFDGDVDPEWAENLNSVLDDNKLLTLPSGERLSIPDNFRIILEVDSLEQATPATVSRCGMVWFSKDTVSLDMCLQNLFSSLKTKDVLGNGTEPPASQGAFLDALRSDIVYEDTSASLVADALMAALSEEHIMAPTRERLLQSFKALLIKGIEHVIEYDENHPDFPMSGEHLNNFAKRWMLHCLQWSFAGSATWSVRQKFGDMILRASGTILPDVGYNISDYRVRISDGEYELWSQSVPRMEIESHKVVATDVVITTTDTVRHSDVLGAWLSSRLPLILCGPPGSGKTMTLTNVLQSIQGITMANLNFSSKTTPEIILKTFSQYCNYVRKGKDIVLEPSESLGANNWLVVFCDEINLPESDAYGTQRVIMFMRQLVEQGGFWRDDNMWVKINRIQFVGACNPPTDAGRVVMSSRFLRHAPLLLVDFPANDSLVQIYGTFNRAMMKLFPNLKGETSALTDAMVELYSEIKQKYTPEMQPQYFYSPRELSRWVRGIYEAVVNMDGLTRDELVRIWAHEALRLFCDRLVEPEEKEWCEESVDNIARKHFAGVNYEEALARPIFFSNWMSKDTRRVSREELKDFLKARLRIFYEEELDVPLVIFDEVMDHILRIDRVLRQPMGHCLLIGDSGAGKTVLSKFVSWMNGLSIFQIKAHSKYSLEDFNEDLRTIMRRVGIEGEQVCFIFDESNALGSGFLEAMNALLASGEVPGLFEGDDYMSLMSACRDAASRNSVIADSEEELWRNFVITVQRNLHVVFTMNPSGGEWKNRSTTSPALFNRCVVDWFGTWSPIAMGQVGKEFTMKLDMGDAESVGGSWGYGDGQLIMDKVTAAFDGSQGGGLRQAVVAALVDVHRIAMEKAEESASYSKSSCRTYLSPRDYLALIHNFVKSITTLREKVEDEQLHVNAGLTKLNQTQENVAELKIALGEKKAELAKKENLANEKLQQMVGDQKEAEKSKEKAEKMSSEVEKQRAEISVRKEEAQRDLDEAEPALLSAKAAVKGIKRRDLDEVRNLLRPPVNVRLTLECVAVMMGDKSVEWTDVRKMISKGDFINSILNFTANKLTSRQVKIVKDKYIDGNDDLNFESVMRSSKACGPLYKWAESQVKYSTVFNRVQPLRKEVERLEKDAEIAKEQKDALESEVVELEKSIVQYKTDYATLIRDVEALKVEMETVTTKVNRAESLITSLSQESDRWTKSSKGFQLILSSLIGDGILMAAFLTYSGFFDFSERVHLMERWHESLDSLGIDFRENLSMVESLSKASDRLQWQSLGLPSDSLSMENGVILSDCVRFPLIIDPAGYAIDFIMNKYRNRKIQKTSFQDKAFTKTLAGAIRFGTVLLVENVEHIDPILNPVLNKELQRTGGRCLVRIGTEEVDYSPDFGIILTTKNPAAKLTPDLCSRVTLVNFTVTPSSLHSQSMSLILREEKPEVEEQRINVLKVQGEQLVKLKELEEQMLSKISAVEGNILDDDAVVEGMEFLTKEGEQVEKQIESTADVMKKVNIAMNKFEPLASLSRSLFVLLQSLREISFLYEFSSSAFMKVLESALKYDKVEGQSDEERVKQLRSCLIEEAVARVARGLSLEDKMVFSLLLSKMNGSELKFEENSSAEDVTNFIEDHFGAEFIWQGRGLNHLTSVTEKEADALTPLMLCSAPGHDVSGRVEAMARQFDKDLSAVAMGSAEGFTTAESLVTVGSKRGSWVLLKNCHLCIEWLEENLMKKIQSLGSTTNPDFRLFITSEINPKLPTALLRLSDIIIAEAPSGVKASLSRFFSSVASERFSNPVQNRLYLILGWVHSVIQERLRYVPIGWSEAYGFSEADALHALDAIDSLVEDASGGKKNIDPDKLPWDAIRTTLCKGIFGGRVTQDSDQKTLDNLVEKIFTPKCFDVNFKLVDVDDSPTLPDCSSQSDCLAWIESLPSYSPPTWIGLDASAETARSRKIAQSVISKVKIVDELTADV